MTTRRAIGKFSAPGWPRRKQLRFLHVFRNALLITVLSVAVAGLFSEVASAADNDNGETTAAAGLHYELSLFPDLFLAQNDSDAQPSTRAAGDTNINNTVRLEDLETGKSYDVPAWEIFGFLVVLNRFDYYVIDKKVYGVSLSSMRRNLTHKWVVDNDPFAVNQFLHPLQGAIFFGLARSAGLDYWESLGYAFGGSLLWEIAGETGAASINDLVATGIGGTFLGEPLFRMASLLLEDGGEKPDFWHELGAALISPPLGFTRLAFGDRFRAIFKSHDPAVLMTLRFGISGIESASNEGLSQQIKRGELIGDFHMAYGLPGKPGYAYTRPFDYFDFQFTASSANVFENIMSRGLLYGTDYAVGESYRGIWGLYGSYDYISPQIFRVSSTALSLGTTGQWWWSKTIALQGTVLGGVGYGAAGTIHPTGERDYHYGATPQALLQLRLMFGDRVNLDFTARGYYVSRVASTEDRGSEKIYRAETALTARLYRPHAITLRYVASTRDARYPDLNTHQAVSTIGLLYTYTFGENRSGAVEWRNPEN